MEETEQEKQDREDREYLDSYKPHRVGVNNTGLKWKDNEKGYMKTYHQRRYQREKEQDLSKVRSQELKKRYGITTEDKQRMAEDQDHRCAICRERYELDKLEVDHDNVTGFVRGLLCHSCNLAIGMLNDDPGRAETLARYLRDNLNKYFRTLDR